MQKGLMEKETSAQVDIGRINESISQVKNAPKTGNVQLLKETLNPFKHMDEPIKKAWQERVAGEALANEKANLEFQKLNHIPLENARQIIDDYQQGRPTPVSEQIKTVFDQLRQESIDRGIDVKERKNYLPQVWANDRASMVSAITKYLEDKGLDKSTITDYLEGQKLPADISNRLKLSPSFDKERVFPTYAVGEQYGLTPKYQHPAQLAAHWRNELEKTVSNRDFIETLKAEGSLLDHKPEGFKPIDVSFSAGEQLYANPKLAKTLNEYFRDEDNLGVGEKIAKVGAKTNKALMEIKLSGGVPFTNANFFTTGQVIKNLTAGEVKVLGRAILSNSNKATKGWFRANQAYITDMAQEGFNLSKRTGNWDNFYEQLSAKEGVAKVSQKAGELFSKALNKKTFDNYMPMQVVSTFKNAYDSAISKGMEPIEARKMAAQTTRAFEGIVEDWGRGKTTQEVVNTLFFAPRFREGIVNLLGNSVKSITSEFKNPAFKMNRRFVAGSAISYVLYNLLNKQLTGGYMWENEPGKEFDLKIPYGDGKFVYVALLPSILAFPRNMASGAIATAKGDLDTAGQKFGSLASMPVKIAAELFTNKDYFGNPIYDEKEGPIGRMKSIAEYVGINYNHPYVDALYNQFVGPESKKKEAFELISSMAELPLKFSTQEKIDKGSFYKALEAQQSKRTEQKQEIQKLYDRLQSMKAEGKQAEADKIVQDLSDEEYAIYSDIKSNIKAQNTKNLKVSLYPEYQAIRKLKESGDMAEAQRRVDAMTDEEYKAYEALKKQFDGVDLAD
jgi:hypothetical protein